MPTCCYCVIEIVTLLLERGAPIKVKNALGWSPMSEAVSYGDRQISRFSSLPADTFAVINCQYSVV